MQIVCNSCEKAYHFKPETIHLICDCGNKLIWFGNKGDCEIVDVVRRNQYGLIRDGPKGNIYKMTSPEKTKYFEEKYPNKQ